MIRRRVFWAIFGVAAGVLVAVALLALAGVNAARVRATRVEMERAGAVVAGLVGERLDDRGVMAALARGEGIAGISGELAAIREAAGGSDITVFAIGLQGNLLGPQAVAGLGIDLVALAEGEDQFVEASGTLAYARPAGTFGRRATAVVLLTRPRPVELRPPRGLAASVLLGVGLVAAGVARLLSGNLTRRLGLLAGAAGRLSHGDLSARAPVEGGDEVAELAAAFNQMADSLAAGRERERAFLLAVGHDLRTPLTTIAGYAEALEDGLDDSAEVRRIAGVLGVEAGRLRRLIEDVMLLARLEASEFTLRPEPVDVAAHLGGLLEPFADRARSVGVRLEREIAPAGLRLIDPDRFGQVLANLVENALRFTPETGSVTVRLAAPPGRLVLTVADTGPGIEPEDAGRIFERFYVARKYRGVRPEGSGLGLSIVERLVAAMGGAVSAVSGPAGGTVFTVDLPASPA